MTDSQLRYRNLFFLWLPLALSWMMMSVAGPIVSAGISRLPDAATNLAAHGLTMDIAVLVESPIIMILSASVALVRSRASYLLLRRFVVHLTIALTIISVVVYFTPIYDFLFMQLMGFPEAVTAAARPSLRVMVLWPAAIGWRRLWQGALILHGQSKMVSIGTLFRLAALAISVAVGVRLGLQPGALLGGLSMAISVIVEMLVIAWWSRPLIRDKILSIESDPEGSAPLDYRRLAWFYLPLAGTDAMRVLSRPLTAMGIARAANATLSLAAWPVGYGLSALLGSGVMALQEVVLARLGSETSESRLARFGMAIGVAFSCILGVMVATPLANGYFERLLGVPAEVRILALSCLLILVPMPVLFAARNYLRGVLIWRRQSTLVQLGMFINLLVLLVLLAAGLWRGSIQGILVAAWATLGAEIVEVLALFWLLRRVTSRVQATTVVQSQGAEQRA